MDKSTTPSRQTVLSKTPPASKLTAPGKSAVTDAPVAEEVPAPSGQNARRYAILGGVVAAIVVVVGVMAFIFWPRPEKLGEPPQIVKTEEVQGPRSVLEGISRLEDIRRIAAGAYSDNLELLVDEYRKQPNEVNPKVVDAIAQQISRSNLMARLLGRGGYEIALKKDEKTWLLLTWSQNSGKQIKLVPATSGPPFAVSTAKPPTAAITSAPPTVGQAPQTEPAPVTSAVQPPATAEPAGAAAPKTGVATGRSPKIVIEEIKDDGDWVGARLLLKTTGTMRSGGQYVAIVNGNMVRKGDIVSVTLSGRVYQFVVTSIDTRNVEYKPLDQRDRLDDSPESSPEVKF
jgi:hypothetical protein